MKSNEINKKQLEQKLKKLKDLPLETVSIVDSSGSMLPENVKSMVQTVCEYGFNAGFHGHNNIGLALANCLSAVEAGAKMLDGTLTGLGRSLGNANTEQLAISLRKKGFSLEYDVLALLKLAECFSRKFCNAVIDVDQILMGYAELHSGVETEVRDLCRDKKMGLREFLFKTGESFPARIHPKLFEKAALSSKETVTKPINISWRSYDFDDFLDNLVARSFISPRK